MPEHVVDSGLIIKQPEQDKAVSSEKISRIGLIIPVLNNFEGCVDLLQSVRSKHIITTFVMPQYRERHALAKAWNDGALRAFAEGCDYALISNDDIIFAPETIDNMVAEFERLKDEGVVTVSINNISGQLANKWEILNYYLPQDQNPSTSDHPSYACFLITKDFFEQLGTFDEKFYPAWCEDQDMHQRIHLAGLRAITSTACPAVHVGSVTTVKLGTADSSESNRHFVEKWGSHNASPPQQYTHPYNDPTKTHKDW